MNLSIVLSLLKVRLTKVESLDIEMGQYIHAVLLCCLSRRGVFTNF